MLKELEAILSKFKFELAVETRYDKIRYDTSGMIVINPPLKLASQMASILPWLHKTLVPEGTGHIS